MNEKNDALFQDLEKGAGIRKRVLSEFSRCEVNSQRGRLPFCMACALADFDDEIEKVRSYTKRTKGIDIIEEVINKSPEIMEVAKRVTEWAKKGKYTGKNLFKLSAVAPIRQNVKIGNEVVSETTGYWLDYICNKYGHGCAVRVSIKQYTEMKKAKSNFVLSIDQAEDTIIPGEMVEKEKKVVKAKSIPESNTDKIKSDTSIPESEDDEFAIPNDEF